MKRNQKIASAIAAALSAHASAYAADPSTGEATAASGLQEVVVTAERRSESVQSVPNTIQAITGDVAIMAPAFIATRGDIDLMASILREAIAEY